MFWNSHTVQRFCCLSQKKDKSESFNKFVLTKVLFSVETTQDLWLGDGIFKQSLYMLYQLCIIHVAAGGYNPPLIYALSPNKTEKAYYDFAKAPLQLIPHAKCFG